MRRLARPGRPRLILSHGNGFAIDGYRAFWARLRDEFELVLFDLRNHGRSPLGDVAQHTVANMAADHAAILAAARAMGPEPVAGVFHSVSSIAAIMAASAHGVRWDGLILVDPPIVASPGNAHHAMSRGPDSDLAARARRRRSIFDAPDELAVQFAAKVGRGWVEGAALDMARATLVEDGGHYRLACPPEYEARIYVDNASQPSWDAMGRLGQPAFILGADPDRPDAIGPARIGPIAASEHGLPHEIMTGCGHMLQIERPVEAAARVRAMLARAGIA